MTDADPPLPEDALVDARVRAGRPAVDRVRMDATRARAERALFAVDAPARVGRYIVVETAGSGGMGIVFRAYDPQLDRTVALKIVRARGAQLDGARDRLLSEARTLAQLAHPNVLPIHDVMQVGDDLVVVMEFVHGMTLDAWVRAEPRTWPEIVRVYTEAARGLAAAHAVDVVHRDFKPSNALIGTDGRVRVVDFGLAQVGVVPPDGPLEIVGTLAYMAPEQLADGGVNHASDQFSFFVALYEALLGVRPFAGDDRGALTARMRAGQLTPATGGNAIPAWLRAVLVRGLAFEPGARFASMARVIAELTRVRGWRRWRVPAALVTLTAVATVAVIRAQSADPLADCDGGVTEIERAWGPTTRERVTTVLTSDPGAYGAEVMTLTIAGLDRYRSTFIQIHRDACIAHRRGAMSTVVLDRTMTCLRRRRGELGAAVQVIGELDRASSKNAVDVVARLAPVEACSDVANLAVDEPLIADPAVRLQVIALRHRLERAAALDAAAQSATAIAEARAIDREAERLDQPTIMIEAELLVGRSLVFSGDSEPALTVLTHAEELALARGNVAAAVIAAARRIYVEATSGDTPLTEDALRRELSLLEPLSRSVASDGLARPLLFNNVAAAHQAIGQRTIALADLRQAHAALAAISNPDPELNNVDVNLALVTPDPLERGQLASNAWRRMRASLGASHRQTLAAERVLAHIQVRPEEALPLISDVCERYARDHAALVWLRAECAYYQAWWTSRAGAQSAGLPFYVELARLTARDPDPELAPFHDIATGEVALSGHEPLAALAAFRAAVTRLGPTPPWWKMVLAAHARIGAARALEMSGDTATVPGLLDEAIVLLDARITRNEDQVPRQLRDMALGVRAGYRR